MKPCNPTLGREIRIARLEYEIGKTAEARWVREMDKLECLIQAHEHEQRTFGEKDLEEFQGLSLKSALLKENRCKPVVGGETSPLLEAKMANLCSLLHRYILLLCPASGIDCNTGPSRIDMKTLLLQSTVPESSRSSESGQEHNFRNNAGMHQRVPSVPGPLWGRVCQARRLS